MLKLVLKKGKKMSFKMCDFLKKRIKDLGFNQVKVAEKMGMDATYICKVLNGVVNPSMETFMKLLDVLCLDVEFVEV